MLKWWKAWRQRCRLKREVKAAKKEFAKQLEKPGTFEALPKVLKSQGYIEYTDAKDPCNRVFVHPVTGSRMQIYDPDYVPTMPPVPVELLKPITNTPPVKGPGGPKKENTHD